jgi:threonine dehydrogenase-like Zn-dependent dehydrogenase
MAIIGVGRIGLTHAETVARRTHGARLVAVADTIAERAGEVRGRCGEVAIPKRWQRKANFRLPTEGIRGETKRCERFLSFGS